MSRETKSPVGHVVSSAHLAKSDLPELSEVEFAVTMANNAFQRWITRCADAAGQPGMAPMEVLVLHLAYHRERPKTLADLCLVLNVEDTHIVNYAVRKLQERGLTETGRKGKEKTVAVTEAGAALCRRYAEIREALLVETAAAAGFDRADMSRLAALMRALSGSYDQAARAAASL
ncbi:winged helix DNA-binding protein [Tranquillimonas alkanivorans]|uniref:Predicted transcription regulator, contains HTH domain, MarR family n=1 Tax=Tranquillimonas alkanivorans TaxID=441119 RepID=A0A1I5UQG1_9RHOB|nr:winged helix DNA-binding protein [Tranquillimonas alkanivorans]SFP97544.1 Predicted transcription regulator, contains HTH domain, MarR family [Tranquillimonas alkanivorans]